jgi:hypothetical protein
MSVKRKNTSLSPARPGLVSLPAWLVFAGLLVVQMTALSAQETGGLTIVSAAPQSSFTRPAAWTTLDSLPLEIAAESGWEPAAFFFRRHMSLPPPADFLAARSGVDFLGFGAGPDSPVRFEHGGIPLMPCSVISRQDSINLNDLVASAPLNPFLDIKISLPDSHYDRLPDDDPSGSIFYEARIPPPDRTRFDWNGALGQSFLLMTGLHTIRVATQSDTRAELGGPFWKDYLHTLGRLGGWSDGDTFFTNYTLHPMMGATAGFIQIQNDPEGMVADFGASAGYWSSRLQAFGWSTAFSFLFELGPLSEATIGNVGLHPRESSETPMAWVDLVVTPVMGMVWLVGEDALDRYLVNRIEDTGWNSHVKATFRVALNPCRAVANIARLKTPWHRD